MVNRTVRFILLLIMLTTFVGGVSVGCNKKDYVRNGENNMTTTMPRIPPIDTIMPVKFEAATFALG
jgi:hypothetical protein